VIPLFASITICAIRSASGASGTNAKSDAVT
jgi:hypothetical protein